MYGIDELSSLESNKADLDERLIAPDVALKQFAAIELTEEEAFYLLRGNAVGHAGPGQQGKVRLYDAQRRFLGVGEVTPNGSVAPKRLFAKPA
jgi:tRNA pseudouridine55 synthase